MRHSLSFGWAGWRGEVVVGHRRWLVVVDEARSALG